MAKTQEIIKIPPVSSNDAQSAVPYIVGSNSLFGIIMIYIVKRWANGMLTKIGAIDEIKERLTEIRKDHEYIKEKLFELKHPIQKVDYLDRQVGILETHVQAAHRRLDEIRDRET